MGKRIFTGIICFFFITIGLSAQSVEEQGRDLLIKADQILFVEEGTYQVFLKSQDERERIREYELEAYKKGRRRQTTVWISPRVNRNDVGMRKDRTMYFKPANLPSPNLYSYKTVFVESDFSWGDIMSSDMAYDYKVRRLEEVDFEGKEAYLLVLSPNRDEFYAGIEVYLEKGSFRTLKRVYLTASGEILKEAYYSDFSESNGQITGFRVLMVDEFMGTQSEAVISDIENKNVPESLFNPSNIGRIRASR